MIIIRKKSEQREFGFSSKLLAFFAPGAYQAKEAAKYAYDREEYKRKRWKYALKGLFTPGTATVIKKKAEKMNREGASRDEIRKYLEHNKIGRVLGGLAEAGTGASILGRGIARGVGIVDKLSNNRGSVE